MDNMITSYKECDGRSKCRSKEKLRRDESMLRGRTSLVFCM
jgi:hypothetical protein